MSEQLVVIPIENDLGIETIEAIGKLDAVIINMPFRGKVLITSEFGYTIYSNDDGLMDISYIPIRVQAQDEQAHRIGFSHNKFNLNERITIQVICYERLKQFQEVKLILRYE